MSPVDVLLERLEPYGLRPAGRERWRACCPAHGGKNRSALSVGIGDGGAVLLRCWHGCEVEAIAAALGLELFDLFPARDSAGRPAKRRRLLSAAQALEVLDVEAMTVVVLAGDMARGHVLDEPGRERLRVAAARIGRLRDEAGA